MSPINISLFTDRGLIRQEYNPDIVADRFVGDMGDTVCGSVGTDSITPFLWADYRKGSSVARISMLNDSMSIPFNGRFDVVAIQEDHFTGNVFVLTRDYPDLSSPGSSSSSSSSSQSSSSVSSSMSGFIDTTLNRSWIVKYDTSSAVASIFKPTESGSEIFLRGCMDCKLDHVRRTLWVTESGNNDILGINADTGVLIRRISLSGMICPTVMAFSPTTGDVFVRAWDSSDNMEHMYWFGESGLVSSFMGSDTLSVPDVRKGLSTGAVLPPSVDSVRCDHVRNKLWWVSGPDGNNIYMVNLSRYSGGILPLFPEAISSSSSMSESSSSTRRFTSSSSSKSSSSSSSKSSSSTEAQSSSNSSSQSYPPGPLTVSGAAMTNASLPPGFHQISPNGVYAYAGKDIYHYGAWLVTYATGSPPYRVNVAGNIYWDNIVSKYRVSLNVSLPYPYDSLSFSSSWIKSSVFTSPYGNYSPDVYASGTAAVS